MTKDLTQDILQWDVKSWKVAIEYWDNNINWNKITNGLELGGRQGGLSLWLALKGVHTTCSDLNEVTNTAKPLHLQYHVSSLVKYQDIDATKIPYENYFDVIVFKSIIGGIGRNDNYEIQQQVFKEIHKALKPGGTLLFAENLIASPLHQLLRKRFVKWGSTWRYVSLNEMKEFLKDFSSYEINTTGVLGALGRNENQRNLFSKIDKLLLNYICPKQWQYIGYGIARK
jgi:SAM-dependent methyltransferase